MTENPLPRETPSDTVARRMQELRRRRGWSARRLAEACAAAGAPQLTESVIANIESGRRDESGRRRRDVTVDELVALGQVLVVPLYELLPEARAVTVEQLENAEEISGEILELMRPAMVKALVDRQRQQIAAFGGGGQRQREEKHDG